MTLCAASLQRDGRDLSCVFRSVGWLGLPSGVSHPRAHTAPGGAVSPRHEGRRPVLSDTIKGPREARAWHKRYGPLAPKADDAAPDFELHDATGESSVRLSDYTRKKPVALVFGSFT